jgi:type II secretory pathway pseudopilin PulG
LKGLGLTGHGKTQDLKGTGFSPYIHPGRFDGALAPEGSAGKPAESGYILLGVIILLAIFVIAMAVTAPRIAADIQRDREVETMHRGKQYIRALQLYYRKFNAYPPSMDALVKTNEIRFLRKRYLDPITGKDDWKPIMYCQNKAPIAMGFFGQPLGPTTGCGPLAGTGPSGGNGLQGSGIFSNQPGQTSGGFGNPSNPSQPGPGGVAGTDPNAPQTNPTSPTGTDPNSGQSGSTFGSDNNNQTFGGGGIMGFSPPSDKKSILVYKKKSKYNEWEFTYSTLMDQQTMQGGNTGTIGQPVTAPGTPTPGGPGFGPGGGPSPTPTPTPTPTPPPQQ